MYSYNISPLNAIILHIFTCKMAIEHYCCSSILLCVCIPNPAIKWDSTYEDDTERQKKGPSSSYIYMNLYIYLCGQA